MHAFVFQLEVIPVLCFLLIVQKRLDDVVYIAAYLRNMSKKYDNRGEIAYYAICLLMISETNFFLEPMDEIEAFVEKLFLLNKAESVHTAMQHTLAAYIYSQTLKMGRMKKAILWKRFYCNPTETARSFFDFWNQLKYAENALVLLCRDLESSSNKPDLTPKNIKHLLDRCGKEIDIWRVFQPRYLHCVAYYTKLMGRKRRALEILREAEEEAKKADNLLEQCWISLNQNYWKGDHYYPQRKMPIFWRSANFYGMEEWSQMMYVLPLP